MQVCRLPLRYRLVWYYECDEWRMSFRLLNAYYTHNPFAHVEVYNFYP